MLDRLTESKRPRAHSADQRRRRHTYAGTRGHPIEEIAPPSAADLRGQSDLGPRSHPGHIRGCVNVMVSRLAPTTVKAERRRTEVRPQHSTRRRPHLPLPRPVHPQVALRSDDWRAVHPSVIARVAVLHRRVDPLRSRLRYSGSSSGGALVRSCRQRASGTWAGAVVLRKSSRTARNRSASCHGRKCPAPASISRRAPGMASAA
jgi:hypothetical protein